ncbi:Chitinase 2 [Ophidiomyces ophidiicola]|nr:Chitinase 2 [Ophidiomyces ophidiicola]
MGPANIFTAAVAAFSLFISSLAYNPSSRSNLVVYWGQGVGQNRLSYFCEKTDYDIIVVGFINVFPDQGPGGWPGSNFGNQCADTYYYTEDNKKTKLLNGCYQIMEDLPKCKALGKTILLSLGGGAVNDFYQIESEKSAVNFADFLWGAFGPVKPDWKGPRPFGNTAVDGFDFDIEKGSSYGYSVMVKRFRYHFAQDSQKKYYISAAPQCIMPDAHLGNAMSNSEFDFIFVQFYNNRPCSLKQWVTSSSSVTYTIDHWVQNILQSGNPSAKLFIGLPASKQASAHDDYLTSQEVNKVMSTYMVKYPKTIGGIMLWEATESEKNKIENVPYAETIKKIMLDCDPIRPTSTVTSLTVTSTTKMSTSSTTQASSTLESSSAQLPTSSVTTETSTSPSVSSSSASETTSTEITKTPSSTGPTSPSWTVTKASSSSVASSSEPASSNTMSTASDSLSIPATLTTSASESMTASTISTSSEMTFSTKSQSASSSAITERPSTSAMTPTGSSVSSTRQSSSSGTSSTRSASSEATLSTHSLSASTTAITGRPSGSVTRSVSSISMEHSSTNDATSRQPSSTQSVSDTNTSTVGMPSSVPTITRQPTRGSTSPSGSSSSSHITTSRPDIPTRSESIPVPSGTETADPTNTTTPPSLSVTRLPSSPVTKDHTTLTTIITKSYVTICPTGFTTVTATYTTTYCPDTVTPRPTQAPTPGAPVPLPDGWTTIITECQQCAATPTTVTLTVPMKSATLPAPTEKRPVVTVIPIKDSKPSVPEQLTTLSPSRPAVTQKPDGMSPGNVSGSAPVGSDVKARPTGGHTPTLFEGGAMSTRSTGATVKAMIMLLLIGYAALFLV